MFMAFMMVSNKFPLWKSDIVITPPPPPKLPSLSLEVKIKNISSTSYFPAEHKFKTNVFNIILFCAVFLAANHVTSMSCSSAKREHLHV